MTFDAVRPAAVRKYHGITNGRGAGMATVLGAIDAATCVGLDDPAARDATTCGSKAASLAVALSAGLPVMPGFVITTAAHQRYLDAGHAVPPQLAAALRPVWAVVSKDGALSLVVRSSSTIEDVEASSMAGRFRSVLNV